jgi:hypothetical protein
MLKKTNTGIRRIRAMVSWFANVIAQATALLGVFHTEH